MCWPFNPPPVEDTQDWAKKNSQGSAGVWSALRPGSGRHPPLGVSFQNKVAGWVWAVEEVPPSESLPFSLPAPSPPDPSLRRWPCCRRSRTIQEPPNPWGVRPPQAFTGAPILSKKICEPPWWLGVDPCLREGTPHLLPPGWAGRPTTPSADLHVQPCRRVLATLRLSPAAGGFHGRAPQPAGRPWPRAQHHHRAAGRCEVRDLVGVRKQGVLEWFFFTLPVMYLLHLFFA